MPKVNIKVASVLHVLLILGQITNAASGYVPSKYQFLVAGILGVIQAVVGILQHYSPSPAAK